MRNFILVLILSLVFCRGAEAGIAGKIINQELTSDGFIKITSEFIDDKNTSDKSDDEQVGTLDHRLWNPLKFENKTKEQIEAIIQIDLDEKSAGNLMYQYIKNKGGNPLVLLREQKAQTIFDALPELSVNTKKINLKTKVDINEDGYCEEEWTIYPDGTELRVVIAPQSCK